MSGWAPGVVPDVAAPDISAVADPASQQMFMYMIKEQRDILVAMRDCIVASNAATAGMVTVVAALESTRSEIAAVVPLLSQAVRGDVVLPGVINASSPLSGTSFGSELSSGSTASVHVPDGPLHCPFCPHRHDSEKVHVQHLVRLIDRYVSFHCLDVALIDR